MIGQTISHYRILEKLGEGGMGVVYKAEDTRLNRIVALKFLPPHITPSTDETARFRQEAHAIAALNHSGIATVYDLAESHDGMFLVLEYMAGGTLKAKLSQLRAEGGQLPVDRIVDYGVQIADSLAHAHRHHIVHRDIKSENVMVSDEGKLKITDFGLAKLKGAAQLTKAGTTVGTAAYMSPEQLRGDEADGRSDIFSLGVLLYEMATGRMPFRGEHEAAISYSIVNDDPIPFTQTRSDLPQRIQKIILRCLAKDPSERYQTAEEISKELKAVQRGEPGEIGARRAPVMTWIIAEAVVVAAIAAFVFWPSRTQESANSKTIAVLPFENLGGDQNNEYFSEGITEDILTQLAKISDLRVISRTTMMQYKGTKKTLKEIGKELDAGVVLEGSVRRSGDQVRITAQLINAATDDQLWADAYDKELTQVFAIQSDVAQKIASALQAKLSPQEKERIEKIPTSNSEAYTAYLRGRYYWTQRTPEAMRSALQYFQQAASIDPNYALAWTGIADCYQTGSGFYFGLRTGDAMTKAEAAVEKALQADSSTAEVFASLGAIQEGRYDWEGAERSFHRAIELNPGYATAHMWLGEVLSLTGRLDESIEETKKCVALDPLSLIANSQISWYYLAKRDAERAIVESRRTLSQDPNFYDGVECYAQAMMISGRPAPEVYAVQLHRDSIGIPLNDAEVSRLRTGFSSHGAKGYWHERLAILLQRVQNNDLWWHGYLAESYAQLGEQEQAINILNEMYNERDPLLALIRVWTYYDPLRKEPGFKNILQNMRLDKNA